MRVVNLPAANREFARAVKRYLQEGQPARAAAFIDKIDRAAAMLASNPYLGVEKDGVRGFVISGFPYTIFYFIRAERVVIAAIAHHGRHEGYWRKRLPS